MFSLLTTEANDVVRPVHAKAMPVLLTTPETFEIWLTGTPQEALRLQRPLADAYLQVVSVGPREDGGGA